MSQLHRSAHRIHFRLRPPLTRPVNPSRTVCSKPVGATMAPTTVSRWPVRGLYAVLWCERILERSPDAFRWPSSLGHTPHSAPQCSSLKAVCFGPFTQPILSQVSATVCCGFAG